MAFVSFSSLSKPTTSSLFPLLMSVVLYDVTLYFAVSPGFLSGSINLYLNLDELFLYSDSRSCMVCLVLSSLL